MGVYFGGGAPPSSGTGWDSPDLAEYQKDNASVSAAMSAPSGWKPPKGSGYTPGPAGEWHVPTWGPRPKGKFDLGEASQAYGFSTETPTGYEFPTGSWGAFTNFIKQQYGMSARDFMEADPEARYEKWAEPRGIATKMEDIPLNEAGMPARPPKSPEEAAMFQFLAGERTREKNESMMANAIATIQHAIGLLRRGGKGAAAVSQSPMISQLSDVYRTTQFTEPDYSYWLLPEARGSAVPGG